MPPNINSTNVKIMFLVQSLKIRDQATDAVMLGLNTQSMSLLCRGFSHDLDK